jgi:hypothetical protein
MEPVTVKSPFMTVAPDTNNDPETTKTSPVISVVSPNNVAPERTFKEPLTTRSPPNEDFEVWDPETKNTTSLPGKLGKTAALVWAMMTLPVIPMWDESREDPDMFPINATVSPYSIYELFLFNRLKHEAV